VTISDKEAEMTKMLQRPSWADRTRELAVLLTGWPSVTGTPEEARFAFQLQTLLQSWPAVRSEDVWLTPARPGHAAWNLYVLVRGQSPRTVLLAGHYDTVSTEDYGDWQVLAHDAEALTDKIRSALPLRNLSSSEQLATQDLTTEDYLFGRGLLDMKGGLAAGLAVLERYAALPLDDRPGHLLLVATPDEEGRSSGARAVAHDLPGVARERDLRLVAGINLDATADVGTGEEGRSVYLGTVGKLLVSALVVGRPSHAAYPFDGVSATLLAATLVAKVEGAPEFADGEPGDQASPPVCLELKDSRTHYDVTTPARVWCAFNVLTQSRTPTQVLSQFRRIAHEAAEAALGVLHDRARAAGHPSALRLSTERARVLTFGELRAQSAQRAGEAAVEKIIGEHPSGADPLEVSRDITSALVTLAALEGPAIVLGFGSLYYPPTQLGVAVADRRLYQAASRHAQELSVETGEPIQLRRYFAGISDMSFLGQPADPLETQTLCEHTPHPGLVDPVPPDALDFPVVNIGPWGRDYHQRLERIFMPYSFATVPELLWRVTHSVLTGTPL